MYCSSEWNCPPGSIPYTVKSGDSLYSIANRLQSTVERIMEVNPSIDPDNLKVGSVVCVPQALEQYPTCFTTNYFVVGNSDTIYSISQYFGVSPEQILYSNIGIDPDNIYDGIVLCIPLAKPPLCVSVERNTLTLNYNDGSTEEFNCQNNNRVNLTTTVNQKQLDTSFGGRKRLQTATPRISICSKEAQLSISDIVLDTSDMDYVFNKIPVGTEVKLL